MRLDGEVVRTFLPRTTLGIFTVKAMFTQVILWLNHIHYYDNDIFLLLFQTDEYVLYYNSGLKSILLFRVRDTRELARYLISFSSTGAQGFRWFEATPSLKKAHESLKS